MWSNGLTSEDLSDIGAGTYSVTATDENGCSVSIEVDITETELMAITETHSDYTGYGVSCNGASDGLIDVTVTGGTGNYTYMWSNGLTSEDLSDIGAGIYSVTATDENGCSVLLSIELVEPFADPIYDCSGACWNDVDLDGVCDENEIVGCQDISSDNYNPDATDSGDCEYLGCIDLLAINYDDGANVDDGTCIYPPWDDVIITGCNAQLALTESSEITIDNELVTIGDWIGVFYTDNNGDLQCGGQFIWDGVGGPMAIWGDDETTEEKDGFESGESLIWMIWDFETDQIYTNVYVQYLEQPGFNSDGLFECGDFYGLTSLAAYATISQTIEIPSGWYMFSTYVDPLNPNMEDVVEDIYDNIIILKDWEGKVVWPTFGFNTIGDMKPGEGYQIKCTTPSTLELEGDFIPYDYPITHDLGGWFILAYLHQEPANAFDMMAPIYDDQLLILKSWNGNVVWPTFGFNTIGDMTPGEGYQIKTDVPLDFVYPNINSSRLSGEKDEFLSRKYTKPQNTGNNMVLGIRDQSWVNKPELGDEIVIYDNNGLIVGNAPYVETGSVITIWGDDLTTAEKDGLSIGEPFIIHLFRHNESLVEEIVVHSWEQGLGLYNIDGISIAGTLSHAVVQNKKLIQVTDILGREMSIDSKQSSLLYIYDDGSIEKKYILK